LSVLRTTWLTGCILLVASITLPRVSAQTHSGPKDLLLGIGFVGRGLTIGGDDLGPAEEVQNLIETELPIINLAGLHGYNWAECQPEDPLDGPDVYKWPVDPENAKRVIPGKSRTVFFSVHGDYPKWLEFNSDRYWQKFEAFVEAMTVRLNELYGDIDFIFENEPNTTRKPENFKGNWADWYMHCLKHFYVAVHRADAKTRRTNRVIGGNLAGRSAGGIEELYQRGFEDYCDVIGDHPYPLDIRDGVAVWDLAQIHAVQVKYGDGNKKIFISEGWGSGRSAGFDRSSHLIEPSADEIENMWLALTKGWDNLMTPRENWDPSFLYGVKFFCGNDNWGAGGWRERAQTQKDEIGNVKGFIVDGYWMTPDIAPQFWNGGLTDYYGNSKDCLMHVFPGDGLVFMNPGFELRSSPPFDYLPHFWTTLTAPASNARYSVDNVVFHGGSYSLKLVNTTTEKMGVRQLTAKRSIRPGEKYRVGVWCRTEGSPNPKVRLALRFQSVDGQRQSDEFVTEKLIGTGDWRQMMVSAVAPDYASRAEVVCSLEGTGTLWFDDVTISAESQSDVGIVKGYTLDEKMRVVPHCIVRSTTGGFQTVSDAKGYYEIKNVAAGTYDFVCRKQGYVPFKAKNQTVAPGKVSFVSFYMGNPKPGLTITRVVADKSSVSQSKGIVTVAVTVSNSKPYQVMIWDVGIFVEQNGTDSTGKFAIIPSSQNPKIIPAQGSAKFKFMLKPTSSNVGLFSINAYAFGQEDRPNLLKNGDFDNGLDHPYWSWENKKGITWELDTVDACSSPYALKMTVNGKIEGEFAWAGNHSAQVADAVPASPGKRYILGAYHKDQTKGRVDLNLFIEEYYFNGKDLLYNGRRFSAVPHRSHWSNDYIIYETGDPHKTPGIHPTNRLRVSVGAWSREDNVSSIAWWDDVYLKEEGDWLADDRADSGVKLTVTR